jgi:hypothetical protein
MSPPAASAAEWTALTGAVDVAAAGELGMTGHHHVDLAGLLTAFRAASW